MPGEQRERARAAAPGRPDDERAPRDVHPQRPAVVAAPADRDVRGASTDRAAGGSRAGYDVRVVTVIRGDRKAGVRQDGDGARVAPARRVPGHVEIGGVDVVGQRVQPEGAPAGRRRAP